MRIAIMQPYFIPYAGYFRLFHAADLFVIFDCVQFVRRGWVHRNRLPNVNNELDWLTLPLEKAPQSVLIKEISFLKSNPQVWQERLRSFPQLLSSQSDLVKKILSLEQTPLNYIVSLLKMCCEWLKLPFNVIYSSQVPIEPGLKGEEKIIAIAKHFQATEYINLAGGKALYRPDHFKKHELQLKFLDDYKGSYDSIVQRIITENANTIHDEIVNQSQIG